MTKRLTVAAILFCALISIGATRGHALDDVKIDGKWSGQIPRPSRSYDAVFEFKVDGEKLTGNVHSLDMDWDIVGGKVKGDTISFKIGDTPGNYSAKVSGDEMSGEVSFSGGEFGSRKMAFKLSRAKD